MNKDFIIGGKKITNRLLTGTGKYADKKIIEKVIAASNCEVVTMALRRVDFDKTNENILDYIPKSCTLLTNTSGARTANESVRIARLSRAAGCGNWVKIEVISYMKYLLPDNEETIKATKILADEGFVVLSYMNPDIYTARKLVEAGAATVMPLGAPIGTNKGLKTEEIIKIIIEEIDILVIVDAGIGKPSDVCKAMELGADSVLVNTAITTSDQAVASSKKEIKNLSFSISVHSLKKIKSALKFEPDYLLVSPILKTECKRDKKLLGMEFLKAVQSNTNIPLVALGGIKD